MQGVPLSEALGIELRDFDITKPCTPEEGAELRRLLCKHHLLLVRGQSLSNDDHNRFVENFGMLSILIGENGDAGYVSNKGTGLLGTGSNADDELLWHADGCYAGHPGIATSLFAKEVAPESAPTMFANAVRALEKLPPALRARIAPLTAVHVKEYYTERSNKPHRLQGAGTASDKVRSYEHPVAYQPPHIGEKVLYVNRLMTSRINGLPQSEAEALMEELFTYLYAENNTYTHRWQINDVIIWDNIALQHRRPKGTSSAPRHLRRLSLDGWNTGDGILEWFAPSGRRDLAQYAATGR